MSSDPGPLTRAGSLARVQEGQPRSQVDRGARDRLRRRIRPGLRDTWRAAQRFRRQANADHVTLLAAGVAFYALLALVPAMFAALSLYGLIFNEDEVRDQIVRALSGAPVEVQSFVAEQLARIAKADGTSKVVSLVLGVLVALWSASGGMNNLLNAIDAVKGDTASGKRRNGLARRGTAILVTLSAIGFALVAIGVMTVLPRLFGTLELGAASGIVVRLASWLLLLVGLAAGLSMLYRVGPDPQLHSWFGVSPGALVALAIWLAGSAAFSAYTENFGSYHETYGSLGAIVVVMLWLWITCLAVLVGASVNADITRRHRRADALSEAGEVLLDAEEHGEGITDREVPLDRGP